MQFETKDSGEREEYASGMRRDTNQGKPRYDLIPIMPLRRLAELYARGSEKYGDRNWELANSKEELQRFKASGLRHLYQWLNGETDEDHAIAVVWNIFAYLTIEEKLKNQPETKGELYGVTVDHIRRAGDIATHTRDGEACWCRGY